MSETKCPTCSGPCEETKHPCEDCGESHLTTYRSTADEEIEELQKTLTRQSDHFATVLIDRDECIAELELKLAEKKLDANIELHGAGYATGKELAHEDTDPVIKAAMEFLKKAVVYAGGHPIIGVSDAIKTIPELQAALTNCRRAKELEKGE